MTVEQTQTSSIEINKTRAALKGLQVDADASLCWAAMRFPSLPAPSRQFYTDSLDIGRTLT